MFPEIETIVKRYPPSVPTFSGLKDMWVEPGTRDDWEELHELHYKSTSTTYGHFYRCVLGNALIGVCVLAPPRGLLAPRHELFPLLKPSGSETKITNTYRYKWLNENSSLNTRTVVDTMFRGVGIAYRLLNLSARMEGKRFCEIQSSMSRYNQFAQKAGFVFAKAKRSAHYEAGLDFFRNNFRANPVDYMAVLEEYRSKSPAMQAVLLKKTIAFYYAHSAIEKTGNNRKRGTSKVEQFDFPHVLKQLQQLVFAVPLYGVYENPDCGRKLPERLPLLAFDRQATNEPLRID